MPREALAALTTLSLLQLQSQYDNKKSSAGVGAAAERDGDAEESLAKLDAFTTAFEKVGLCDFSLLLSPPSPFPFLSLTLLLSTHSHNHHFSAPELLITLRRQRWPVGATQRGSHG